MVSKIAQKIIAIDGKEVWQRMRALGIVSSDTMPNDADIEAILCDVLSKMPQGRAMVLLSEILDTQDELGELQDYKKSISNGALVMLSVLDKRKADVLLMNKKQVLVSVILQILGLLFLSALSIWVIFKIFRK